MKVFREVRAAQRGHTRGRWWLPGSRAGHLDADVVGYTDVASEAGLYDIGTLALDGVRGDDAHSFEADPQPVLDEEIAAADREIESWSTRRTQLLVRLDEVTLAKAADPPYADLALTKARLLSARDGIELLALQAELRATDATAAAAVG